MNTESKVVPTQMQRLSWQCRRGLYELDVLFQYYLEHQFALASATEQDQFASLLQQQDDQLQAWLLEGAEPDPALSVIVTTLRQTRVTGT
ncbi:MAG: succinate dehydrogenase assembly factor 2 [Pseudomonadota bacterium]